MKIRDLEPEFKTLWVDFITLHHAVNTEQSHLATQ